MLSKIEARVWKPWRKTLIIKLLGRKIGYKALESRLYEMWVKDGIIDIIDLMHDYFMVNFSAFSDYEFALMEEHWIICDHYLIIKPWETNFPSKGG